MNLTTKLLALLTCLFIICGCFASCENTGGATGGNTGNNGDETSGDSYVATIKTVYATQDFKMKGVVASMGSPITTVSVDGGNIKVESSSSLEDIYSKTGYTYKDGMLYYFSELTAGELSTSSYKKAVMFDTDADTLLSKVGSGASIDVDDFKTQEKQTSGNLTVYTCTDISDEAKEGLRSTFAAKFEGLGAMVRVADVSLYSEVTDGLTDSATISCNFVISMDGEDYGITMHLQYSYDYDAEINISSPENAGEYILTELDQILG